MQEQRLGVAYILEGEHEFQKLRWIFKQKKKNNSNTMKDNPIIEISSDNEIVDVGDSSINELNDVVGNESEENSDKSF